jgi:halogenation protein CepH
MMAARSINTALRGGGQNETACFEEFEARYRKEYSLFHDFLVAFYDMHQDETSYFWSAKKVTGSAEAELESFVELVGGGASNERALVDPGSYLAQRGPAFRELGDLVKKPVAHEGADRDVFQASLVKSVLKGSTRMQVQAALGANLDEHVPVRDGGLVPSADGMHWSYPQRQGADAA